MKAIFPVYAILISAFFILATGCSKTEGNSLVIESSYIATVLETKGDSLLVSLGKRKEMPETDTKAVVTLSESTKAEFTNIVQGSRVRIICDEVTTETEPVQIKAKDIQLLVQVDMERAVRTNDGIQSQNGQIQSIIINSRKELDDYIEKNEAAYHFSTNSNMQKLLISDFQAQYFENHMVIILKIEENSGSIRQEIKNMQYSNKTLEIEILRSIPNEKTNDLTDWHIFAGIEKLKDINSVQVTTSDISFDVTSQV